MPSLFHLRYLASKRLERLLLWFVWRLPRRLVYWAAIRLMAHATQGPWSSQEVPALLAVDALKRWELKA
jgi:hypothetical protein